MELCFLTAFHSRLENKLPVSPKTQKGSPNGFRTELDFAKETNQHTLAYLSTDGLFLMHHKIPKNIKKTRTRTLFRYGA